jgi:hypothetical protein
MTPTDRDTGQGRRGDLVNRALDLILALWIIVVVGAYYHVHGHIDLLQRLLGLAK